MQSHTTGMNIKILTLNIHKGISWHGFRSTFNQLVKLVHQLNPDLIFFQEILGMQVETLAANIGSNYGYGKNVAHSTHHYGNAILCKYPMEYAENFDLSTHRFEHRGLLHSITKINNQRVHLLCVHLGLFRRNRYRQFQKIVSHVKSSIDESEAIILAGDFNDWDNRATSSLIDRLSLHEAFLNLHGTYAKTFPAWAPILKLDRLYCRGFNITHADRLINYSWRYLSDHIGLAVTLNLMSE